VDGETYWICIIHDPEVFEVRHLCSYAGSNDRHVHSYLGLFLPSLDA